MGAPKDKPANDPASSGRARIRQRTEARLRDNAETSGTSASGDDPKSPPLGTPAQTRPGRSKSKTVTAPAAAKPTGRPDASVERSTPTAGSKDRTVADSKPANDQGEAVIDLRDGASVGSAATGSRELASTATGLAETGLAERIDPVDLGDDWTTAELPGDSAGFRVRRRASPGLDHLAAALVDARRDLLSEVDRHRGSNPAWLDEAGRHFADATDACVSGRIESGWRSLRHANRLSIEGASEVGVHARIHALRAEAMERVPGWTGMAITQILDEASINQESNERRELVMRATGLRDHSYATTHHHHARLRREITWSLVVLTASVLGIVVLAQRNLVDFSDASITSMSGWLAVAALLFGLAGASISAIHRVSRATTHAHDGGDGGPASNPFRPVIGGAVALVVTAAIAGGAIGPITATAPLVALFAFLAGFSERLG